MNEIPSSKIFYHQIKNLPLLFLSRSRVGGATHCRQIISFSENNEFSSKSDIKKEYETFMNFIYRKTPHLVPVVHTFSSATLLVDKTSSNLEPIINLIEK